MHFGIGASILPAPRLKVCARVFIDLFDDCRVSIVRSKPPQKVGYYRILPAVLKAIVRHAAELRADNRPDVAATVWPGLGWHVRIIRNSIRIVKKKMDYPSNA